MRTAPHCNDVLSGRGQGAFNHPGNVYLRQIAQECSGKYQAASKIKEKTAIATHILHLVKSQEPPGRFLKETFDESGHCVIWEILDEKAAMNKVKQAIRDINNKRSHAAKSNTVQLPGKQKIMIQNLNDDGLVQSVTQFDNSEPDQRMPSTLKNSSDATMMDSNPEATNVLFGHDNCVDINNPTSGIGIAPTSTTDELRESQLYELSIAEDEEIKDPCVFNPTDVNAYSQMLAANSKQWGYADTATSDATMMVSNQEATNVPSSHDDRIGINDPTSGIGITPISTTDELRESLLSIAEDEETKDPCVFNPTDVNAYSQMLAVNSKQWGHADKASTSLTDDLLLPTNASDQICNSQRSHEAHYHNQSVPTIQPMNMDAQPSQYPSNKKTSSNPPTLQQPKQSTANSTADAFQESMGSMDSWGQQSIPQLPQDQNAALRHSTGSMSSSSMSGLWSFNNGLRLSSLSEQSKACRQLASENEVLVGPEVIVRAMSIVSGSNSSFRQSSLLGSSLSSSLDDMMIRDAMEISRSSSKFDHLHDEMSMRCSILSDDSTVGLISSNRRNAICLDEWCANKLRETVEVPSKGMCNEETAVKQRCGQRVSGFGRYDTNRNGSLAEYRRSKLSLSMASIPRSSILSTLTDDCSKFDDTKGVDEMLYDITKYAEGLR